MSTNQNFGRYVYLIHSDDDKRMIAHCNSVAAAACAATLLNRARILNDIKRQYTAAARLIAEAESLDGFEWIEQEHTA